jgi:hypothetical protein
MKFFNICPRERVANTSRTIQWKQFQYEVVGTSEEGRPKKRIKEVLLTTSFSDFMEFFTPTMQQFIRHNFVACWQSQQEKLLHACLQRCTILTHIDFYENYTFQAQNEIQSMYYYSDQISILVQVTYHPDIMEDDAEDGAQMIRETHYYISNDKSHDTLFVQHCFMQYWRWMQSRGFLPSTHYVFSDGCVGQFKSAKAMYFVARYVPYSAGRCFYIRQYYS